MKTLSDGCSVIFGLLILYVWFQFHWPSALGFVGLFLLWAFKPLFFAVFKTPSNLHTKKIIKSKPRKKLKSNFLTVPSFSQYYPSVEIMSADQLTYYKHWRENWKHRHALDIQGQLSYVFCYAYDVKNSNDNSKIIRELADLRESYRGEEKLASYLGGWVGDALVLEGRFTEALNYELGIDKRLSLKLALNMPISAKELSSVQKPRVTKHGAKYFDQIIQIADKKLGLIQLSSKEHILAQFVKDKIENTKYSFFNGVPRSPRVFTVTIEPHSGKIVSESAKDNEVDISKSTNLYYFKASSALIEFSKKLFRDAENYLRKDQGIPLIGEGWVSETALFYSIKEAFPEIEVIHHGKPKWLGWQHLDVYIPEHNVGIEYQGLQHNKPIEFFGGQHAYEKTVERDKKKKRLCLKNGCTLIYVYPNYDFEKVKAQIKQGIDS